MFKIVLCLTRSIAMVLFSVINYCRAEGIRFIPGDLGFCGELETSTIYSLVGGNNVLSSKHSIDGRNYQSIIISKLEINAVLFQKSYIKHLRSSHFQQTFQKGLCLSQPSYDILILSMFWEVV